VSGEVRYSAEVIDLIDKALQPDLNLEVGFSFVIHLGEQWMAGSIIRFSKSRSFFASDPALLVTTFIAVYSGLIPMFSTAGNTTDDGVVGAILEDCFQHVSELVTALQQRNRVEFQGEET
jgi:hypothetical protein